MSAPQTKTNFPNRFQGWFWWTAPISLVADAIAIAAVFATQQQYQADKVSAPPNTLVIEPRVLGFVPVSDAIFLTGLFTAFTVISMIYHGYRRSRADQNLWSILRWSFLTAVLVWVYMRLWLHEYWWACGLISVIGILLAVGFALFRLPVVTSATPGSDSGNMLQLMKVGFVGVGVLAVAAMGFFFISNGTAENIVNAITATKPATVGQITGFSTPEFDFPLPTATSQPLVVKMPDPAQFVRDYYAVTDRDDTATAWVMLSPNFKTLGYPECIPITDQPCYTFDRFFRDVDATFIQQAQTITSTANSATVDVVMCFVVQGNCVPPYYQTFQFLVVSDPSHTRWLIEDAKLK